MIRQPTRDPERDISQGTNVEMVADQSPHILGHFRRYRCNLVLHSRG
jgi:hypothetical protein